MYFWSAFNIDKCCLSGHDGSRTNISITFHLVTSAKCAIYLAISKTVPTAPCSDTQTVQCSGTEVFIVHYDSFSRCKMRISKMTKYLLCGIATIRYHTFCIDKRKISHFLSSYVNFRSVFFRGQLNIMNYNANNTTTINTLAKQTKK